MNSSRMRTTAAVAGIDTHTPRRCEPGDPRGFGPGDPPGYGPGDPPGQIPLNFPPGCGPENMQGILGYPSPPPETCCKACWDTTCNECWDSTPPRGETHTCKNITIANYVSGGKNRQSSSIIIYRSNILLIT